MKQFTVPKRQINKPKIDSIKGSHSHLFISILEKKSMFLFQYEGNNELEINQICRELDLYYTLHSFIH